MIVSGVDNCCCLSSNCDTTVKVINYDRQHSLSPSLTTLPQWRALAAQGQWWIDILGPLFSAECAVTGASTMMVTSRAALRWPLIARLWPLMQATLSTEQPTGMPLQFLACAWPRHSYWRDLHVTVAVHNGERLVAVESIQACQDSKATNDQNK